MHAVLRFAPIVSLLAISGCVGLECDRRQGDPVEYRGGNTFAGGSYYETGAWDEPFLHFPSGRSYDLEHELSAAPGQLQAYLSFSECPFSRSVKNAGAAPRCEQPDDDDTGPGIAESAGNQAIFEVVSDERVRVRNDTCAEFYLRVVATTGAQASGGSVASTTDAGQDGGG